MSSSNLLQQLWELDSSSSEFHAQLAHTLLVEDSMSQVQDLPSEELKRLVEGLDSGLDPLNPVTDSSDRCLFELRRICGTHKVLPASHTISTARLDVSSSPIASGAFADIHEGTLKGEKVCVKKVRMYFKDDSENLKLFYHEAVVWKHIRHRNIVPFHGATLEPPQLVSEWMEYGDLPEFLKKHPKANRLGLLHDVAEALNYIHSRNLVHGSIMGANILVDRFGCARVTDFSLTTVHPNRVSSCNVSELCDHNTRWTAPEVSEETGPLTKKADVFSFAMLMVEIFTGEFPFHTFQDVTAILKIRKGERPPRPIDPALSDDMWAWMRRCWDQNPQLRPEMSGVVQNLTLSLLRSLLPFTEASPEFQVALNQFYNSTEYKVYVGHLCGAELEEFVNFLDAVLLTDELDGELLHRTLHNLREVCSERTIVPGSCIVPREFSRLTDHPVAVSRYAEVWSGQPSPGEGNVGTMDVCIKVIKSEKVHKGIYGDVALWAKLNHQNILWCFGVTVDRLQIVMDWMPNGEVMKYVQEHKPADRVCLLIDIASGLNYLHSRKVTHGNLKQENILMDSAGHARLSDIGFSKLAPAGESRFDWARVGGVGCRWTAPEVFREGEFTERSDMFSYGFIATEIFTGNFLWEEDDEVEVRSRIFGGERPRRPEGEKKHTLTTELWRTFPKCWGKVPAGRILASEALNILRYLPQRSGSYNSKMTTTHQPDQGRIDELDKVLDTGMVSHQERPVFLNRLCKMCDTQRALPRTMVIGENVLVPPSGKLPQCAGGFGVVYKGGYYGRTVAIKVMPLYVTSNQDLCLSGFCREAITWRHLRHPNILPLLGATLEAADFRYALVSEWMDNGDITSFVKRHEDVNRAQLLIDAAHGLEYLHDLNFVHGDLKGPNILIKKDHRACLADFGLSTIVSVARRASIDASSSMEVSETSLMHYTPGGSKQWMSPELLDPERFGSKNTRPTKQSDCYAFGMVVYEVLCGKEPYAGCKRNVILEIIEGGRPSKPDVAVTLGFTDGLWWTLRDCWLEDRNERPDVKAVLTQLTHAAWAWDRRWHPTDSVH